MYAYGFADTVSLVQLLHGCRSESRPVLINISKLKTCPFSFGEWTINFARFKKVFGRTKAANRSEMAENTGIGQSHDIIFTASLLEFERQVPENFSGAPPPNPRY